MKGFTTNKTTRLEGERKNLEARLGKIESDIEKLLQEARRCKDGIAKVDESIRKLTPRLKCEEEVKRFSIPKIEPTEPF